MTMERCHELFRDKDLQEFIRGECRRRTHDEDMQEDLFASAWAWISCNAPDQMDLDTLKEWAEEAIEREYRQELRERNMVDELIRMAEIEEQDVRIGYPWTRRSDAGTIIEPR